MGSSPLNTDDPLALRCLMTEAIFPIDETSERTYPFYGGNKRRYLFITNEPRHQWMSPEAWDAFTKTLAALKLSVDDIALINVGTLSPPPQPAELGGIFNPRVVVLLGAALQWPETSEITVYNGYSFDDMLADADKKRMFWNTVKTLLV